MAGYNIFTKEFELQGRFYQLGKVVVEFNACYLIETERLGSGPEEVTAKGTTHKVTAYIEKEVIWVESGIKSVMDVFTAMEKCEEILREVMAKRKTGVDDEVHSFMEKQGFKIPRY